MNITQPKPKHVILGIAITVSVELLFLVLGAIIGITVWMLTHTALLRWFENPFTGYEGVRQVTAVTFAIERRKRIRQWFRCRGMLVKY
jgi:ABC-type amino acid transport system permease subunit